MITVNRCLWCHESGLRQLTKRKDGVGILKCRKCKLLMVDTIPEDLDEYYYTEEYYNGGESNIDTGYAETYELMAPAFLYWQNSLLDEVNAGLTNPRLLEIGCATGNLLDIIRDTHPKWRIQGIDISDYAAEASRAKGHDARVAYIEDYSTDEKYDTIFSSETMEHLDNLKSFLEGVKKNLKDDGAFVFYVPSVKEVDVRKEGVKYIRFTSNLEHLLHFTPDFFEKELGSFFGADVMVREFDAGFGPFIVGVVSSDRKKLANLSTFFGILDSEDLPKSIDNTKLENLAIVSLKFGKFSFAEKIIKKLEDSKKVDNKNILALKGLLHYHKGELVKSIKYFEEYLKILPGSQFAIRSLLAGERELARLYENENIKLHSQIIEQNHLEQRIATSEAELADLKQSKIVGTSIKIRKGVGKTLDPIRRQKKK